MVDLSSIPIRKTVVVPLTVERAFELFTRRLGEWWPMATHSIHGEGADVVVEGGPGGRIFERGATGGEANWARIVEWEPPGRVVLEWKVNPAAVAPTEVEVRFAAQGGGTRVELVHRGWERLGTAAEEGRHSYDGGWDEVLGRYVAAARTQRTPVRP